MSICKPSSTFSPSISHIQFHDTIDSHTRSPELLGKKETSYGTLLVSIILGKLPVKTKQNLTSAHGKRMASHRATRCHSRWIVYTWYGIFSGPHTTTNSSICCRTGKPAVKLKGQCPFCKDSHSPSVCTAVTDSKQRTDIIRQNRFIRSLLIIHFSEAQNRMVES